MTTTNLEDRGVEFLKHLSALFGSIQQTASWERDERVVFALSWAQKQLNTLIADARREGAAKAEENVSERVLAAKEQTIDTLMTTFQKARRP